MSRTISHSTPKRARLRLGIDSSARWPRTSNTRRIDSSSRLTASVPARSLDPGPARPVHRRPHPSSGNRQARMKKEMQMATTLLRPDQPFYPSPKLASEAPVETLAYMVTFDPTAKTPDRLVTLDVDPKSPNFGNEAGHVELPNLGDELHHFGWNACSSALCPYAPHPHIERRYLLVPGLRSSRIYVFDTKADRTKPKLVHTISAEEIASRAGYSHKLHIWALPKRRHKQEIDLGPEQQMVLELRPAHDPTKAYGFVGVVTSLKDLSSSIWVWHLDGSTYKAEKVIEIPAEPAAEDELPPLLKGFKAVPPLVSDINLSLDDRWLYVSAWGTGEFLQYDVSDPFKPKKTGSVHLGGIVRKAAHPKSGPLNGGPQMVEVSRDGKRIYLTNSLYASWDVQFYPEGIKSWVTLINAKPNGGLSLDDGFFTEFQQRTHQVHLEGGDASSDSYCYP